MRRRTREEREYDLIEIERRLLRGERQAEIARALGMSRSQVLRDVRRIEQQWREALVRERTEWKMLELARLAELERTYWEAWLASRRPRTVETVERAPAGTEARASVRTEQRDGNPAYLAGILACIRVRIELLGLDEPLRISLEMAREEAERLARVYDLDPDEVLAEAERLLRARATEG
jgi:hypothetical protein